MKKVSKTKNPKGTIDFGPKYCVLRDDIISIIKEFFIKYGGKQIDTPVIECLDTVKNLYGDEFNKLVYKLDDQGGEKLILRYDLTVPFARYIANNGLTTYKRFQIGKVYRMDDPQIFKGRYREFTQCDFDIVGYAAPMIQEAEIIALLSDILSTIINKNDFTILVNSRNLLYYLLQKCGIKKNEYCAVCSTLDKIPKLSRDNLVPIIKKELHDKNINHKSIIKIIEFIEFIILKNITCDPFATINLLHNADYIDDKIKNNMNTLFNYLLKICVIDKVKFEPLLARGLDYYTGLIFEAVYFDKTIMPSSIAAGGRYDNMLEKLSNKGHLPAIGMSIGIERIMVIVEKTRKKVDTITPKVYIATIGNNMIEERLKLCIELRRLDIICEMSPKNNPKMRQQFDYVFDNQIPYMIIIGNTEIQNNTIKLKDIDKNEENEMLRIDAIEFLVNKFSK
jgi:histidyl-tRNA synthetase